MIRLHPILTVEKFDEVLRAAKEDDHRALSPTNWLEKEGQVAGAFGFASVPLVSSWLSTKVLLPRETLEAVALSESICEHMRLPMIVVPVPETSPMYHLMEKLGYENTGTMTLFCKELTKKG